MHCMALGLAAPEQTALRMELTLLVHMLKPTVRIQQKWHGTPHFGKLSHIQQPPQKISTQPPPYPIQQNKTAHHCSRSNHPPPPESSFQQCFIPQSVMSTKHEAPHRCFEFRVAWNDFSPKKGEKNKKKRKTGESPKKKKFSSFWKRFPLFLIFTFSMTRFRSVFQRRFGVKWVTPSDFRRLVKNQRSFGILPRKRLWNW